MTYVAHVDALACSAHGDCAVEAPDAFRVDDVAVVIGIADPEAMLAAAQSCPMSAITLVDAATGEQVYP